MRESVLIATAPKRVSNPLQVYNLPHKDATHREAKLCSL